MMNDLKVAMYSGANGNWGITVNKEDTDQRSPSWKRTSSLSESL